MSRVKSWAVAGALVVCVSLLARVDVAQAQRSNGYFVILGSFPDRPSARQRAASGCLGRSGERIRIVLSDNIDSFTPGLWVVVTGPFRSQEAARETVDGLRRCVRDAYVKYGRDIDD